MFEPCTQYVFTFLNIFLNFFYEMWMLQSFKLCYAICTCVSLCEVPLWCFLACLKLEFFAWSNRGWGGLWVQHITFAQRAKFLLKLDSIPLTFCVMCVEYVFAAKPLISRLLFVRLYCFTTSKSMYHKNWKKKLQ